ncbi:hypothetical protein L195_g054267 [Trifolium pratense]|uniref:Tf2-1-like SH3-like domain-containing protein n=1 Tax=Trifolium pratense TaxID=57577 RepID=A0A2K3KF78_TRIPR|nr:hypothetical protein L195_g054267 [Trifolium pratense]
MKKQADKHRADVNFQVGELVLVKLQPYRQQSVALRKNQKLGMRYFGPFEIIARVGNVAYKLKLPDHAKIHPVFHISQLKPFKGPLQDQYLPLPLTMSDSGPIINPIKVLQARTVIKGNQTVHQVLIQWDQHAVSEATWEAIDDLQQKFPSFNLEDKVNFNGEGIVMKPQREEGLEAANESANQRKGPQNMYEKDIANNHAETAEAKAPRKEIRTRTPHSMWKEYVKA